MTGLVHRAQQRVKRFVRKWDADSSARRFMAYCRKKWPWDPKAKYDSVVLMSYWAHKISLYCNAHTVNYLARRTGSGIETYAIFGGKDTRVRRVYESFGARLGLDASWAEQDRPELEKQADEIFHSLKSKWDLLELRLDGLKIGDLIYDSYLRWFEEPTVKLDDPRLRRLIFESVFIYRALANYLKVKHVEALITDDYSYHECGILTRVLMREKVPVYFVCFGKQHFVYRMLMEPETGYHDFPFRWEFHHYRKLFRAMPEEEQVRCREIGRQHLDRRLAGHIDKLTNMQVSPFGARTEKVFPENGRPRIVILMHDFFDSPHYYRWMLFPDFYEWMIFLFEKASETEFDWYVKPHPATWDPARGSLNRRNVAVTEELLARFPKIKLMPPTVSNIQIVEEGISAMFTMYGTAGHEFARLGVPVVNAADNPHIAYPFNYHPTTLEEYADLIHRADRLASSADPDEVAEYVYMNYYYVADHHSTGANPLPPSFFDDPNFDVHTSKPNGYDHLMFSEGPAREAEMKKYYDHYFREHPQKTASK